jgi:hypothetical protein
MSFCLYTIKKKIAAKRKNRNNVSGSNGLFHIQRETSEAQWPFQSSIKNVKKGLFGAILEQFWGPFGFFCLEYPRGLLIVVRPCPYCTLKFHSTLNKNYSTHNNRFLVSTTTSLVVPILLLVITTRLKVERTWIVKNSKITKVWKQYKHILILYNHTSILILLRLHMFLLQKKHPRLLVR